MKVSLMNCALVYFIKPVLGVKSRIL